MNKRIYYLSIFLILALLVAGLIQWKKHKGLNPALPYDEYFVEYAEEIPAYEGPETINGMSAALLWKANKGVHAFDEREKVVFPDAVKRVWIDIGASKLETTREALFTHEDLGLIAIEPLEDCWGHWPKMDRLIAIPFAIHEIEGLQIFHQTKSHNWSSLVDQIPFGNNLYSEERKVVKDIEVEVYRLSRILEVIPESLPIEVLKVDVQGVDYEVLKSAGALLSRVERVKVEVNLIRIYQGDQGDLEDPEKPFNDLLGSYGFKQESRKVWEMGDRRHPEDALKVYADIVYVNQQLVKAPLND